MKSIKEQKSLFNSQLGSKAKVDRTEEKGERSAIANAMLREIGKNINALDETSEYIGSCAVHVYKPKGEVKYLHFQCQVSPMQWVEETVADKALTELKGALMEHYGRDRQVLRSGF